MELMSHAAPEDLLRGLGTRIFLAEPATAPGLAATQLLGITACDRGPGWLGGENMFQQDPSGQVLRGIHLATEEQS